MSHIYEVGLQTGNLTAIGPVVTIVAGAAQCSILEICVTVTTALTTAEDIQYGRPAAAGTGTLTGTLVQAMDSADVAGLTTLVTAFGTTTPTAPAHPMRQWRCTSAAAALGVVFTWEPGELVLPASGQFVVWAPVAQTNSAFDVFVKVAE